MVIVSDSFRFQQQPSSDVSVLNTTFEKEDDDKENVQPLPPLNTVKDESNEPLQQDCENSQKEAEEKFLTSEQANDTPDSVDLSAVSDVENLLANILHLFEQVCFYFPKQFIHCASILRNV